MEAEGLFFLRDIYKLENAEKIFEETHQRVLRPGERAGISDSYQQSWRTVSEENINLIREIYEEEFYLFGYPDTPFVDFSI